MKRPILTTLFFLVCVSGCEAPRQNVQIPFAAHYGGKPITCDSAGIALSDLRFYVYDVRLITVDGESTAVMPRPDADWQSSQVALIDLEDGQGACENGTDAVNEYFRGEAPGGEYLGLEFTVGVPFELNHANPLLADAPLDDSAMHWHWRSGYKFLRAGVRTSEDGFWLHLGSSACKGKTGAIESCEQPNRVTVSLPEFDAKTDQVIVHLDALFRDVDLEDGTGTDCSSGPTESSCDGIFSGLGLTHDEPALREDIFVAEVRLEGPPQ